MNVRSDYQPIENYGAIGDLRTIALVSMDGSIDFMCSPHFDSPSIFARLLDSKKGGFFHITTNEKIPKAKQLYVTETNILLTRFNFVGGMGEVVDFMPVAPLSKRKAIIRQVNNIQGNNTYTLQCCPRFNYGRSKHSTQLNSSKTEATFTKLKGGKEVYKLRSSIPLILKDNDVYAEFTLEDSATAEFIFENISDGEEKIPKERLNEFTLQSFKETYNYWRTWARQTTYKGLWRETVIRSALALKLLISDEFGCMIAAPTFSLPEIIGKDQNWDYRFSWIRDSAFSVFALVQIGYVKEAESFMHWIEKICTENDKTKSLQPLYAFDGSALLKETILQNFEGYRGSKPVRIGNAANKQIQLDIYGEFMDAIYLTNHHIYKISHDLWESIKRELAWLSKHWRMKDQGIWELRDQHQDYLHSKVMCWVAFDRAIKIANHDALPFPKSWITERDAIYEYIHKYYWDKKRNTFVHYRKSKVVNASLLLMPIVKFISGTDPKWLSTLKAIEKTLAVGCHVYRFAASKKERGNPGLTEGTFSACSFWYIECLARSGQLEKAEIYFDKMLGYANHLGLYSEELSSIGTFLGNFPQAFTHLSLISAAYNLNLLLEENKRSHK